VADEAGNGISQARVAQGPGAQHSRDAAHQQAVSLKAVLRLSTWRTVRSAMSVKPVST
jgi:hypothetical protein